MDGWMDGWKDFPRGTMGLLASWGCWDLGFILGLTQGVKDPALPHLAATVAQI